MILWFFGAFVLSSSFIIGAFTVMAWKHGGSWGLGLFAVLALWMMSRMAATPAAKPTRVDTVFDQQPTPISQTYVSEPDPVVTVPAHAIKSPVRVADPLPTQPVAEAMTSTLAMRNEILDLAQSDPATTAAVLSQWLAETR